MEDLKLSRNDLLDVLNEMNIIIPADTKLKQVKLRHRLEKALDAAQRYSRLFNTESTLVNPADYPTWDMKKDLAESLYRKMWGGLSREGERRMGAFAKLCLLIVTLGDEWKKGIGHVIFTDEKSTAIVVQVCSVHAVNEKRPVVVIGYAHLTSAKKTSMKETINEFLPTKTKCSLIKTPRVEQAMLLFLLTQNSKHLSPEFEPPQGLNGTYNISFLLPTAWLHMDDIGRLNKSTGCVVCGDSTRSICSACQSTQYCGKECQRMHWGDHKFLCRSIASGTWYTVTLEPQPSAAFSGFGGSFINRYDDWDDHSFQDGESRSKVPTNIHGDKHHIVKLQLPMGGMDHMYLYDREKSFQAFLRQDKNPDAFVELVVEMGNWPKLYRWAKRVGDWEWKICVNREPQPEPRW